MVKMRVHIVHVMALLSLWSGFAAAHQSIVVATENFPYHKAAFLPSHDGLRDILFIAADQVGAGNFAIAAVIGPEPTIDGTPPLDPSLRKRPFTPEKIIINSGTDAALDFKPNPLFNTRIDTFALFQGRPLATFESSMPTQDDKKVVCWISQTEDECNLKLFLNPMPINDALAAPTSQVKALAASPFRIFAAVAGNGAGGDFGGLGAGIAVLSNEKNQLNAADANTGDFGANKAVAVQIANQEDQVVLYWDTLFQRLFVGLKATGIGGGNVVVLVGRLEAFGNQLILETIVPATAIDDNSVVGSVTNLAQVYALRSLYTSTGFGYLIVNGDSTAADERRNVYAFPFVQTSTAANVGKIAKKDDVTAVADNPSNMTKNTDIAAHVGGGPLPIENGTGISNLIIFGETVFVGAASPVASATARSGIFASTAILGTDGRIRAWTAWQRAGGLGGRQPRVFGFGRNVLSNYWYLVDDDPQGHQVHVTSWGTGLDSRPMIDFLANTFPNSTGGIQQLFVFGPMTPGFTDYPFAESVYVACALGIGKIDLIQLANVIADGDDALTNIAHDVVEDNVLKALGIISAAEVSRIPFGAEPNAGWLFVGGTEGLAVLRTASGDGWPTTGLAGTRGFENRNPAANFKSIGSYHGIRKLVAEYATRDGEPGGHLYVMTERGLERFLMEPTKFDDATTDPLGPVSLNPPAGAALLDFVIASNIGMLATNKGLFWKDLNDPSGAWTQVLVSSFQRSMGPVTNLFYVPAADPIQGGNVYALASNIVSNLSELFRFNVTDAAGPEQITELHLVEKNVERIAFARFGNARATVFTDGAGIFQMMPRHLDLTGFVSYFNMPGPIAPFTNRFSPTTLPLDIVDCAVFRSGNFALNGATGALMIPGDWGMRIQE